MRALAPLIADKAEQAEQERKPVDEVIRALEATGVFRSHVPKKFGGFEIDPETFVDIGLAVSESCTSTGWVTLFYIEHNWMLSQFPQQAQEAVFGRQPYMLAPAALSPTGAATPVDGGHRLTGRWGWGTGIMHADWVLLGGLLTDGDPTSLRMFLVPRAQVRVDLTWDAAGMQGTGSNDIVVSDVFVPETHSEPLMPMTMGRGRGSDWLGSPCYRHPMIPLLCLAAGVPALGAARRAVALFKERLAARSVMGSQAKQLQLPAAQMRLGHASARVHDAETVMRAVARELKHWGDSGEPCPFEERGRMRVSVAHAVDSCRTAVREVMEASGASAHLKPHPLQRIHRDVHTLSCHTIFDLDASSESYGRMLLGFPPSSLF